MRILKNARGLATQASQASQPSEEEKKRMRYENIRPVCKACVHLIDSEDADRLYCEIRNTTRPLDRYLSSVVYFGNDLTPRNTNRDCVMFEGEDLCTTCRFCELKGHMPDGNYIWMCNKESKAMGWQNRSSECGSYMKRGE